MGEIGIDLHMRVMCSLVYVYVYGWLVSDFKEVAPGGGGRLLSKSWVEERI